MTFDRDSQRAAAYDNAPLEDLLTVLLRQWKRPLGAHNITLTDAEAAALALSIVQHEDNPAFQPLRMALIALVSQSKAVLAAWGLTFAESLETEMTAIPGWETTADFLTLAEQKANAELRISTGAALLVALGASFYIGDLHAVVAHAEKTGGIDLDSAIARRVLAWKS
jgi:hypothetical protein